MTAQSKLATPEQIKETRLIYRLRNTVDKMEYIGSTTKTLSTRLAGHKASALTVNTVIYQHMRKVGIDNWFIELVHDCSDYPDKDAMHMYEQLEILKTRSDRSLNTKRGFVTKEQTYAEASKAALQYYRDKTPEEKKAYSNRNNARAKLKKEFARLSAIEV